MFESRKSVVALESKVCSHFPFYPTVCCLTLFVFLSNVGSGHNSFTINPRCWNVFEISKNAASAVSSEDQGHSTVCQIVLQVSNRD